MSEEEKNLYQCPNCSSFLGYEEECKEEEYQSTYGTRLRRYLKRRKN